MKTPPDQITDPTYKAIWEKLQGLKYPCTIVVYGEERTHRTTFRGEHQSAFGIAICNNAEEAWYMVDCGYVGYPPDLDVYAISGDPEKIN